MTELVEQIEDDFEMESVADEVEAVEADDTEDEEDSEGVVISIAGEPPAPEDDEEVRAPEWVRDLRKNYREEKRRAKDLEQKLARLETQAPGVAPLGPKPTLEKADYDTDRYEKELANWYDKKRQHDDREVSVKSEQQAVQREWERKLEGYQSAKAGLKVRDFEFAEDVVQDNLSVMQQGMIVQGADNAALVVYALGKNPKKAKELASITDPVKFAFAVAKLETQLKISNRKAQVSPERKISGTGRPSGAVDSTLDRLRADAEKTGDYSKVFQYKKQKQKA
jgi:hypothetical protein